MDTQRQTHGSGGDSQRYAEFQDNARDQTFERRQSHASRVYKERMSGETGVLIAADIFLILSRARSPSVA